MFFQSQSSAMMLVRTRLVGSRIELAAEKGLAPKSIIAAHESESNKTVATKERKETQKRKRSVRSLCSFAAN